MATKIEWVKNPDGTQGMTWNPITGCLNHDGGMCKGGGFPCYAYKLANGRLKSRYLTNSNIARPIPSNSSEIYKNLVDLYDDPFYPRFWEEKFYDIVTHPKKRKGIFVCDMGELFGGWLPKEWQDRIFGVIKAHPQHRFYLLTKQPQNLIKFSPFPENCFVGVSATGQRQFDEAVKYLKGVKATVKYISFEPLLERIKII